MLFGKSYPPPVTTSGLHCASRCLDVINLYRYHLLPLTMDSYYLNRSRYLGLAPHSLDVIGLSLKPQLGHYLLLLLILFISSNAYPLA
jgi:hypothetical protein